VRIRQPVAFGSGRCSVVSNEVTTKPIGPPRVPGVTQN
jgi:hypothetical protein